MIYGYARVSTKEQLKGYGLEVQETEIKQRYPNVIMYTEAYTGTKLKRPTFNKLLKKLVEGDTLVCAKLDRFARNTLEGLEVIKKLMDKKISIHILNFGLVENTPMGKFLVTTLLAVAELERNLIVERTQSGKKVARQRPDFQDGRPKKWTDEQINQAILLLDTYTIREVVEQTGISKSTLMRARKLVNEKALLK